MNAQRFALGALVVAAASACDGNSSRGDPSHHERDADGDGGFPDGSGPDGADAGGTEDGGGIHFENGGECSVDHWCWEQPLPQGNALFGVFAVSDDDVWAVGGAGTILHYKGSHWSIVES